MKPSDESIMDEVELFRIEWAAARERAEEIIRDHGWTEEDGDFEIQVELEARRQWEEDCEREMLKCVYPLEWH